MAGYGLSRYRGSLGFWLLLVALVFRAIPHSSLLPSFFNTALVFMGNAFVHLVESSPRMHRLNELNRELEAK